MSGSSRVQTEKNRCGTLGGYSLHYVNGEQVCESCNDAHTAYVKGLRTGRRISADGPDVRATLELQQNHLTEYVGLLHKHTEEWTNERSRTAAVATITTVDR